MLHIEGKVEILTALNVIRYITLMLPKYGAANKHYIFIIYELIKQNMIN